MFAARCAESRREFALLNKEAVDVHK